MHFDCTVRLHIAVLLCAIVQGQGYISERSYAVGRAQDHQSTDATEGGKTTMKLRSGARVLLKPELEAFVASFSRERRLVKQEKDQLRGIIRRSRWCVL